jgi:cysteine synthase B
MNPIIKDLETMRTKRQISRNLHITDFIGNTPLIKLSAISKSVTPVKIFAKAEWFNPGGSVKDRAALNMIRHGIESGMLNSSKTILDATSGNTGIALAMIGASLGFRVKLCLPENAGEMHKQILTAYGAELVFTDPFSGTDGSITMARKIISKEPNKYFYVDQYNNEKNWQAHFEGTGPEITYQTRGQITHFVAGLGSSGTFIGTGRWLKKFNPTIQLISVQPDTPLHGMEGMKHMETALVPGIYDPHLADRNTEISSEEAQIMVKRLASEEGLLVGNSAGGAMAVALKIAGEINQGIIVVIFPDSAVKYMSQPFWKDIAYAS